jgi:hypothetical protein
MAVSRQSQRSCRASDECRARFVFELFDHLWFEIREHYQTTLLQEIGGNVKFVLQEKQ